MRKTTWIRRKHKLVTTNTLYKYKHSRRTILHSPDGITHNQIDYILNLQRFKSSINNTNTRTYPGATINRIHNDLAQLRNPILTKEYNVKFKNELHQLKLTILSLRSKRLYI